MWPNLAPGLTRWIDRLPRHAAYLDGIMRFFASDLIYLVPLTLIVLWFRRDGFRPALEALVAAAVALGIGKVITEFWSRKRPFVVYHFRPLIHHAADASFPSDHLLVLGAVTAVLFTYSRYLGAAGIVVSLAVAFARVFVGIHYVSDVVYGFLIGAVCGILIWLIGRKLSRLLGHLDRFVRRVHLRPVLF